MKTTKNLIRTAAALLACLTLASCTFRAADKYDVIDRSKETAAAPEEASTVADTSAASEATTAAETASITANHPVGIYADLEANGNYTRLTEWRSYWYQNTDICILDVIPSDSELLIGTNYKKIWTTEAEKYWGSATPRHRFELCYKLNDGTEKSFHITKPSEADAVKEDGYLEVYLYDDIHAGEEWYSHLTDAEMTETTVVSSVKITGSDRIYDVESIYFRVYSGMQEDYAEVELIRIW